MSETNMDAQLAQAALEYHRMPRPGKIAVMPTKPMTNQRDLSLGRDEGMTKLLFDETTHRLIGAGCVGPNAGELIAETALALEMGADATDVALTVHPPPTRSETVGLAAEAFEGTITDLYLPRKR